jgi:ABC-type proline/glycine betaine transport system permease subunit
MDWTFYYPFISWFALNVSQCLKRLGIESSVNPEEVCWLEMHASILFVGFLSGVLLTYFSHLFCCQLLTKLLVLLRMNCAWHTLTNTLMLTGIALWLFVIAGIFCSILLHSAHCLLRKANNGSLHSPGLKRESFLWLGCEAGYRSHFRFIFSLQCSSCNSQLK